MASYRILKGSKGTLGGCRSVFGWLGLNPAGVSLFRMHRPLHVLGALKFTPTKAEAATWKCFQPSVRELFVPILWLPRRCVFDGFLQEFEGFKGYVRPLSGSLSLAGWAWILLGFPCFACIVHSMFSGPVSSLQPRPKLPPILRCRFFESCRLKVFPAVRTGAFRADFRLPRRCVFDGFLQEFEGFKGYVRPLSGRLSLAG